MINNDNIHKSCAAAHRLRHDLLLVLSTASATEALILLPLIERAATISRDIEALRIAIQEPAPDVAVDHERMQVLVLSTGHTTREEAESMESEIGSRALAGFLMPGYGFIAHVPEDSETDPEGFPHTAIVFNYCRQHGYEWVRFDSDGPTIAGLPTHTWK